MNPYTQQEYREALAQCRADHAMLEADIKLLKSMRPVNRAIINQKNQELEQLRQRAGGYIDILLHWDDLSESA